MEELEKGLKKLKEFEAPWGEQQCQPAVDPHSSQRLDHQLKNRHGGTHDSCLTCSRRWPCWTDVEGVVLGPEVVPCPIIRECQGVKIGVGGWGSTLTEAGGGVGERFLKGRPGKRITSEM